MSTTIDSLQIEIQSNSTNAARGIKDLSVALAELKTNGSINSAIKNLKNLSAELRGFSDASNATRSLGKLAGSLERLKSIGSVRSLANSITKLGESLRTVDGINIGDVAPKLEQIATAVAPLSAIKAGGINTMANGLKKLDEVTKTLDDATINRFAERIQKLNTVLEPLSAKMTTIKAGLGGINSAARSAGNGVQQMGDDVNGASVNLASFIHNLQAGIQAVQKLVDKFSDFIADAIEWDGISARFGRGFGAQAQETYDWIERLNEEMGINTQQFMQYSSVYATMLTGFGVANEDAGKMALGYTELTYDIWAGYNDIYKTFDEAAEAVKSAIAGEVEPVRRAGFTIIESTLEQTAANHGLEISLENATEAQKSYLRYLTLTDQADAQGLVGSYAKELSTAEGLTRTLSQQVQTLAQAFGSLFLPALTKVMPYLQAFVELLTDAVRAIAGFFGIKIQEVDWSGYGSGIGTAAENTEALTDGATGAAKALKDLKQATIGIDELNVISPNDSSSSGSDKNYGGSTAPFESLGVDSLWDESILDSVQTQVDAIKEKLKDLLPVIAGVAAAFTGWSILKMLSDLDDADKKLGKLKPTIETLAKGLAVAGITIAVGKLVWDFTGAYLESGSMGDLAKIFGTTVIGAALAAWLAGPIGAGIVLAASGIVSLARLGIELKEGSVSINDPQALMTAAIGAIETVIGSAVVIDALTGGKGMAKIGSAIGGGLSTVAKNGLSAIDGAKTFLAPMVSSITGALQGIGAALAGVSGWALLAVAAIVGVLILGIVDYDFTDVGYTIGHALHTALGKAGEWITEIGSAIKDGVVSAIDWVKTNFEIEDIWDLIDLIFNPQSWIEKIIPKMIEVGAEILPGLWEGVTSWWENLKENISEFVDGFVQGWEDALGIASPSKVFIEIGEQVIAGLLQPLDIEAIRQRLSEMWESAKTWWNTKKEKLSEYTPSIGSIANKVSEAWSSAKTWWNTKKEKFSEYTPVIGSIKNKVSSAWATAKDWYDKKKEKLKDYTPTIGSVKDKVSDAWKTARDWYNDKKTKFKDYTPIIGSIKDKASAAWKTARDWYNDKKAKFSDYTPSIGSIKDKVKSAWETAKSWWSKNVGSLSTKLNISVPKIKIKWTSTEVLGKTFKYPSGFSLEYAAKGGMFDAGSLIWAGEAGPEILANAGGGKTGVMNVQQMSDAMYEAVYAAVIAANRAGGAGGGAQDINVYLDGRQITASVERQQRERGASIMGNEVYSY